VVDAVLDATLAELADSGPDALSVPRVADRAGVNRTSVYRRWPTREDLVVACLERVTQAMGDLPDTGSVRGDLTSLVSAVGALLESTPGQALLRAAMSAAAAPGIRALANRRIAETGGDYLPRLMERAQSRGEWAVPVAGETVLALLIGALIHRVVLEHGVISTEWTAAVVDLVIDGLRPRP
jgi:AcrR family transcriptional regulator